MRPVITADLLAHSPGAPGGRGDPYARHVAAVINGARERAKAVLRFAPDAPDGFLDAVVAAAAFHDLGKLDPDTQRSLRRGRGARLNWDHVDAGVAHLATRGAWSAAWLVRAHHAPGLPEKSSHFDPDGLGRRLRGCRDDARSPDDHRRQIARTDADLPRLVRVHEAVVGSMEVKPDRPMHGLALRLALSCLVDADHSDTAAVDTGRDPPMPAPTRWAERLSRLCGYVRSLPAGRTAAERARNRRRLEFFEACLRSSLNDPIVACEGPVGIGKTTAVTAYLLSRKPPDWPRRLVIVAPYTNILTQTASRLRRALVLPGERAAAVVAEHHHRADFEDASDRELAALWSAPVVLTTAVSFFETLSACRPGNLRTLHMLPGSAIFIDEAHTVLPTKLWPQCWRWLRELTERWGCRVVLASGSLARFWEAPGILDHPCSLPELMPPEQADDALRAERRRVSYRRARGGDVLTVPELVEEVMGVPGPRLVILNTVQNAALVASEMRRAGCDVLHLSTALTPRDRRVVLRRLERRLAFRQLRDWTLVATSCVEAGVDLSFRTAFRERFTTASLIQVGGRVSRHDEYHTEGGGIVYDFALTGPQVTQHPAARVSADVLRELLEQGALDALSPAEAVTRAMVTELNLMGGLAADRLGEEERARNYPCVASLGRVIEADTRIVVVDAALRALLENGRTVSFRKLLDGSVQLWFNRIDGLGLAPIAGHSDLYAWTDLYDPDFLGYMAGVLSNKNFVASGGGII